MSKRRRTSSKQSETRTPQRPRTQQPSRPQIQRPSGNGQQRVQPSTRGQSPDKFGTNPAPHETHVHVPPELMHPNGGDGGFMDGFENTMYA